MSCGLRVCFLLHSKKVLRSYHGHQINHQRCIWTANKIRSSFIDFFQNEHDHTFVKSSSIIPENDPSLLTVNAGMNQFKSIFLENLTPDHRFHSLKRAVNSQKCIRCGGKHNDLDAVGRDFRHHTFFEMLGNWSFGDYGKKEAIEMAWILLTQIYKLDPNRLVITYFNGHLEEQPPLSVNNIDTRLFSDSSSSRIEPDLETLNYWQSIISKDELSCQVDVDSSSLYSSGISSQQPKKSGILVLGLGSKDNFWEMGFTGPCGPCTEIHYIMNPEVVHQVQKHYEGQAIPQQVKQIIMENTLEVWNLVFIQFNRAKSGTLESLKRRHVDTGMGLERIASILSTNRQSSNYDTDLFSPLFERIHSFAPDKPPYGGSLTDPTDISYRIIADHARMFTVAIADGLIPNTKDAGHKLRRVIRAAHWEVIDSFGLHQPYDLMTSLCEEVSKSLGEAYPEIPSNIERVKSVVTEEIGVFHEKLRITRQKFKRMVKSSKLPNKIKTVTAEEAFYYFKNLGSPLQLIVQLGRKYDLIVDVEGFKRLHENENTRSTEVSKEEQQATQEQ